MSTTTTHYRFDVLFPIPGAFGELPPGANDINPIGLTSRRLDVGGKSVHLGHLGLTAGSEQSVTPPEGIEVMHECVWSHVPDVSFSLDPEIRIGLPPYVESLVKPLDGENPYCEVMDTRTPEVYTYPPLVGLPEIAHASFQVPKAIAIGSADGIHVATFTVKPMDTSVYGWIRSFGSGTDHLAFEQTPAWSTSTKNYRSGFDHIPSYGSRRAHSGSDVKAWAAPRTLNIAICEDALAEPENPAEPTKVYRNAKWIHHSFCTFPSGLDPVPAAFVYKPGVMCIGFCDGKRALMDMATKAVTFEAHDYFDIAARASEPVSERRVFRVGSTAVMIVDNRMAVWNDGDMSHVPDRDMRLPAAMIPARIGIKKGLGHDAWLLLGQTFLGIHDSKSLHESYWMNSRSNRYGTRNQTTIMGYPGTCGSVLDLSLMKPANSNLDAFGLPAWNRVYMVERGLDDYTSGARGSGMMNVECGHAGEYSLGVDSAWDRNGAHSEQDDVPIFGFTLHKSDGGALVHPQPIVVMRDGVKALEHPLARSLAWTIRPGEEGAYIIRLHNLREQRQSITHRFAVLDPVAGHAAGSDLRTYCAGRRVMLVIRAGFREA